MTRFATDPLVQLLGLGLGVFLLQGWLAPSPAEVITVTPELREALLAEAAQTRGATPTGEAAEGVVQQWLDEEVLVREAARLGLDTSDPIVRRRLAQNMRFVLASAASDAPVDDATLQSYRDNHAERYAAPARVRFEQVFLADGDPGAVEEVRQALEAGADPTELGDPLPHDGGAQELNRERLVSLYGVDFADELLAIDTLGEWTGPVSSRFGVHLVRVLERVLEGPAEWDAIRPRVLADWKADAEKDALASGLASARRRYRVERRDADTRR